MMRGLIVAISLVATLGGSAVAAPLKIRNGSAVRVALEGRHEAGVGLRPQAGGWRLEVAATPGAVADVFDVTEGATALKWRVELEDGALFFDQETFVAGHAYRVLVRHGAEALGAALVYLYAPSVTSRHQVTFDDADSSGDGSEGPTVAKKPTL